MRSGRDAQYEGDQRLAVLPTSPTSQESVQPESSELFSLSDLLASADEKYGDRTAVVSGEESLTYFELGEEVSRMARALSARGIGTENIVAVALPRSISAVVALRAIIAAGAAYLPLDLKYPQSRTDYMRSDAAPKLIIDEATFTQLEIEALTQPSSPLHDSDRVRPLHGQSPAYVIYTSGSTGTPKGVVGTHEALANRLVWQRDLLASPHQVQVAKSSLSFIDGSTELLAAFLAGARTILADDDGSRDVGTLIELIDRHEASQLTAVPSLAKALAELSSPAAAHVDTWFLSGEPLAPTVVDALMSSTHSDRRPRVFNSYGSSEVAGDVCVWEAQNWEVGTIDRVLIGTDVPGVHTLVLDERLRPVPDGVVGELYVGGVQCARGYSQRPAFTAERFVADPSGNGQRLFRTGDLVRRTTSAALEFISRADNQISLRGFRIEPAEVEVAIASFPGVDAALVATAATRSGPAQLVAYIACAVALDVDELREHVGQSLPDYMIPARFVLLAQLPTLPNGKIDRSALAQLGDATDDSERVDQPRTPAEAEVALQWAIALGLEGLGRREDPFALGATSLSLQKVLASIADRYGTRIPVSAALADPTPAGLAALINSPQRDGSLPATVVALDHGAQPLWAVCGAGGNASGFLPLARELAGDFTTYALQQQGLENRALPDYSVAKMVRRFLGIIRTIQPHGPYQLTGHSLGGLVALEIARELAASGEQVDPPIILDAFLPVPMAAQFAAASARLAGEKGPITEGKGSAIMVDGMRNVVPPLRERLLTHWRVYTAGVIQHEPSLQETIFWEFGTRAGNRHRVAPWNGNAVVYFSADNSNDPLWWSSLITGRLEIVQVPGKHLSVMRRPVVGDVAQRIREGRNR